MINNDAVSARLLLKEDDEYGVEIWMRPQSTSLSCLHIAALIGDHEAIEILLEKIPPHLIYAVDDRNRTPFDVASTAGHQSCADLLQSRLPAP